MTEFELAAKLLKEGVDPERAAAYVRALRGDVQQAAPVVAAPPARVKVLRTCDDLFAAYWQAEGRFRRSKAAIKSRWKHALRPFFGDMAIDEANSPEMASKYRETRETQFTRYKSPPAPSTRNKEVLLLQRMFTWAEEAQEYGIRSRLHGLPMEDEDNIKTGKLTEAALEKLRPKCNPVTWALTLTLLDSGMREREACFLRWDQFDHETGRTRLLRTQTKNRSPRLPRLSRRALDAVLALPRICDHVFASERTGKMYCVRHLYRMFEVAMEEAGVTGPNGEKITFHTLRHTFQYRSRVEWGWSERTIMAVMGHKTRSSSERYGIVDDEEVDAAYDRRDQIMSGRLGPRRAAKESDDVRADPGDVRRAEGVVPGVQTAQRG